MFNRRRVRLQEFLALVLALLLLAAPSWAVILVGTDDDGTGTSENNGFVLAKFTAAASGSVNTIRLFCRANGNVKVALYADNAGEPGALLSANNTSTAVTATQDQNVALPGVAITSGVAHWIGFNNDTNGNVAERATGSNNRRFKAATYAGFTFPNPAGSGFSSDTSVLQSLAGYGDVSGSGGRVLLGVGR